MNNNYFEELAKRNQELLTNIQNRLSDLDNLWDDINSHWNYEDSIYRFYHYSAKVYYIQNLTIKIVDVLKSLAPKDTKFNETFMEIFKNGTNHKHLSHGKHWEKNTRPLLEAFFHAKFMLEMAIKYGKELKEAPNMLPSGWAALLYFYGLR